MSQPNPPPVPSLAFPQESGALLDGELSKGFITPKKEKEAHFFLCRNQSSTIEQLEFNSSSPFIMGIMVGSRESIEQWLRESGPGSSCLWVETKDFSEKERGKVLSRHLKLIYHLHSNKNFKVVPILNETMIEISPPMGGSPWEGGGGLRKAHGNNKSIVRELKRSDLMLKPEIWSPSHFSSNSTGDMSPITSTSVGGLEENKKTVGLVIPEKAYRQLLSMVSSSGIIQEYQEILRRCVVSSNFLDLDFRLLDLKKWLRDHPFAAFLEENAILVVKEGDGLSKLQWIVLKFDFCEGLIKSSTGEDLNDLELVFGNQGTSQGSSLLCSRWWGQSFISCKDKLQEKELGNNTNNLDWKIWRVPLENGDVCGGPLTCVLLDAFGSKDGLSITEATLLKSLFGSSKHTNDHSSPTIKDAGIVLAPIRSKGMSWKEQCALSQLRSSSEELKGRGFNVLLNMVLGGPGPKKSLQSNLNIGCQGSLIPGLNDCLSKGHIVHQENDSETKHSIEPLHIRDWLDCGFLEVLLERMIYKCGDKKGESMEEGEALNVDMALEGCLRVLELAPGEGSSQLAKLLMVSLQKTCEDFTKLNTNLEHIGQCELNLHKKSQGRGLEGRPIKCGESMQPNTKHKTPSLQDMFEKVMRLCKLLSLLASQSALVGGPFAESGGLDLILDLYFCLIKRFPTNLRFGVLSNASGVCRSLEQVLPGEILKSWDTPTKVLPCILPRACISGVAQACLMGHCLSPKTKEVDFAWPPISDWTLLCPSKNLLIQNHFDANVRSINDFPINNSLKEKSGWSCGFDLKPEVPREVELEQRCQSTQIAPSTGLSNDCSNLSGIVSTTRNGYSSLVAINHNIEDESQIEGIATFHKAKPARPFVPRLPLSSLRRSTSRFGTTLVESTEVGVLQAPPTEPSLCQISSNTGPSTSKFEILGLVFDVKVELLQTMIFLLTDSSLSTYLSRRKLLEKFQKVDEDYLALQFLPDIVGSLLKVVSEDTNNKTKKMLFEIISLLERDQSFDSRIKRTSSLPDGRMDETIVTPFKNGQGLPFSSPKKLANTLLLNIGERLRTLLCHLTNMLVAFQNSKEEASNKKNQSCIKLSKHLDPLVNNHTIFSGHLLNVWVDIGLLLRALADFLVLWPHGGLVQCVLNSCGKELESVLGLLAEYSSKSNWSFAQILTMEHFLKLLTICLKSSMLEKRPNFQTWSEIDTFFWQLLFVNDLHWNCVKNFTTWVVMKSCKGCFKKLFEGYQKVLWEPLEIYYNMFREKINYKIEVEALECTLHGVDMLKSIFSFLRVSILMMKKRLQCQSRIFSQSCPILLMERLLFLLDFLMNPVEGILMNIIKSPVPCIKLNSTEKDIETSNPKNSLKITRECDMSRNCEHILPDIDGNPYLSNMHQNCRKCPSTPCAANCANKLTSYLKKESMGILADIFSLKHFDDHEDPLPNFCIDLRRQNPFLFRKYVHPFLEITFFYFLKYYNKKITSSESLNISPLTQRVSGNSVTSVHSVQQFYGNALISDGSSTHATSSSTRNDEDGMFSSGCSQDGKVSSVASRVACMTYGQVLRALAQNQTQDINQSFQQIRVMKFLVQQIGLEYEISQVATPRDGQPLIGGIKSEQSLQDLQCGETQTSIAGLLWTGERSKVVLPHTTEKRDDLLRVVIDKMEATTIAPAKNLGVFAKDTIGSTLLLRKEYQTSSKKSHDSRTSLDHIELVPTAIGPLGQQYDFNLSNTCNLNELEKSTTDFLLQNEREVLDKSNRTLEETKEILFSSSNARVESYIGQNGALVSNYHGNVSKFIIADKIGDTQDLLHQAQQSGERREINAGTILKKSRYIGRFFDLNEEVERELAQEGFSHGQFCPHEIDKIAQTTTHFDIVEDCNLQDSSSKLFASNPKKPTNTTSKKLCDMESFVEGFEPSTISTQKSSHPTIPRLNLSKSVRKGGPTIKLDTSMEFEFLPSTTSTLEDSKDRPHAMLRLERELQKEVVSTNRSSKSWEIGVDNETRCLPRHLYRHAGLHVLLLELFVSLMLTPQGTLETSYSDRYPMENRKLNAPFFLSYHLNHVANVYLLPSLSKRMKDFKPAAFRILKLTWRALFNPKIYTNRIHIARGAASQVYTAAVKQYCNKLEGIKEELVVLKIVDVPKGPYDPCKFFDVYSEVEILEKFSGEPAICQILDYGVDMESFILVLKHYKCSLHTWRQGQRGNSSNDTFSPTEIQRAGALPKFVLERLPLYLEVYSAILQAVKKLETKNVVHYDLKCDNILLEPLDTSYLESEFWSPKWPPTDPSKPLPFRICIADFGQSKASTHLGGECTVRNRGTEYVKSPEMLKLLSSRSQQESDFNLRSTEEGVGKAVDVWSLGCLLYELLIGEYLFYDEDWLQFFMRVTLPSEELISKDKATKLNNYGPVVDLLKFILVRDPLQRPSLDEVTICVEQLQLKLQGQALTTTRARNEVLPIFEIVSENSFDSDSQNLDEQIYISEISNVQDKFQQKIHVEEHDVPIRFERKRHEECLECLRGLICHCQCGEG